MLLSAALLLLWMPATDSSKSVAADSSVAVSAKAASDSPKLVAENRELPDAPAAKAVSSESAETAIRPFTSAPVKPAVERPTPTPSQRRLWYTLMAAGHGAAAFDAWSTRRAISANDGTESDPFMRPFVHSNALYAATQVSPAVMDFIGRRMMTSSHPMFRRFWWVPQAAGAGFSFGAGMHNYSLTQ